MLEHHTFPKRNLLKTEPLKECKYLHLQVSLCSESSQLEPAEGNICVFSTFSDYHALEISYVLW